MLCTAANAASVPRRQFRDVAVQRFRPGDLGKQPGPGRRSLDGREDQAVVDDEPEQAAAGRQHRPEHRAPSGSRPGAGAEDRRDGMECQRSGGIGEADGRGGVGAAVQQRLAHPHLRQDHPRDGRQERVQRGQEHRGGQVPDRVHVPGDPGRLADAPGQLDCRRTARQQEREQPQLASLDPGGNRSGADRPAVAGDDDRD